MAGAIIGPLVGGAVSSIFGGGGSSPPPPPPAPSYYGGPSGYGGGIPSLLQTAVSGLGLAGIGPMSNADLQKAAGMADPFSGQRSQYFGNLSANIGQMMSQASFGAGLIGEYMHQMDPFVYGGQKVGALPGSTGTATIDPALAGLGTYDPSMSFRYSMGLDAVERGAAATGMLGSGNMAIELERYGQGFASTEYQNMFNRQMGLQQLMNQTQQQNWSQNMGLQQLYDTEFNQQAERQFQAYQTAIGIDQAQFGQELQLGDLQAVLSGATTGSPATAGKLSAGAYGQSQDTLANFLRGMSGLGGLGGFGGGSNPLGGIGQGIGSSIGNAFTGMNVDPNNPYSLAPYNPGMPSGYYNDTSAGGGYYGIQPTTGGFWDTGTGSSGGGLGLQAPSGWGSVGSDTSYSFSPDYSFGGGVGY